jgi:hypothetical protein
MLTVWAMRQTRTIPWLCESYDCLNALV